MTEIRTVTVPFKALQDAEALAIEENAWATGSLLESIIAYCTPEYPDIEDTFN